MMMNLPSAMLYRVVTLVSPVHPGQRGVKGQTSHLSTIILHPHLRNTASTHRHMSLALPSPAITTRPNHHELILPVGLHQVKGQHHHTAVGQGRHVLHLQRRKIPEDLRLGKYYDGMLRFRTAFTNCQVAIVIL